MAIVPRFTGSVELRMQCATRASFRLIWNVYEIGFQQMQQILPTRACKRRRDRTCKNTFSSRLVVRLVRLLEFGLAQPSPAARAQSFLTAHSSSTSPPASSSDSHSLFWGGGRSSIQPGDFLSRWVLSAHTARFQRLNGKHSRICRRGPFSLLLCMLS